MSEVNAKELYKDALVSAVKMSSIKSEGFIKGSFKGIMSLIIVLFYRIAAQML